MEPHKNLKELLTETLELKNVSLEKLAETTGISERYLWAIQNIEIEKLPAAPYVRGYIKKISEVLNLNHDELWSLYKKELYRKQSGIYDTLPENRFALKHLSKKIIIGGIAGFLIILYLGINIPSLIGKPPLTITNPTEPIKAVYENTILLTGQAEQRDKLTINSEEVFINNDGEFSKLYTLQSGINAIEFKAKRFLGKETVINKQIIYLTN